MIEPLDDLIDLMLIDINKKFPMTKLMETFGISIKKEILSMRGEIETWLRKNKSLVQKVLNSL